MQGKFWGWMAVAGGFALALAGRAEAQYYGGAGHGEVVRCESRDYRQVYCDIDVSGGVRIVNQLSSTACVEGRTWGWDRRGVWVSGGCRGEFEIAGRGDGYGQGYGYDQGYGGGAVVRCESRGYTQVYCNIDTRGGVRLVNQLSGTACIEGQTWGADQRGLWVRGGCRGEFETGRSAGYGQGHDGGLPIDRPGHGDGQGRVICESRDDRYHHCPANIRREAQLVRQLSSSRCVYNRSWGFDRNGVWVDRGCRGEFAVF